MAESKSEGIDEKRMTLCEHLEELRRRIFYALIGLALTTALAMIFGKTLIDLLIEPYVSVVEGDVKPAAMTVTGAFLTYMRVSIMAGLIIASPWIAYQLWQFVAAGLYDREKRYVRWGAPVSAILFVCGAMFFLKIVSYPMLRFFMAFTTWLDVTPVIRLKELIAFMTNLMLVFGLAFQMPIVVLILGKIGLVTPQMLSKYRRHVIVGIMIVAALVTSPSPVDQVLLALPLWFLYEFGIILVRVFASEKSNPQ